MLSQPNEILRQILRHVKDVDSGVWFGILTSCKRLNDVGWNGGLPITDEIAQKMMSEAVLFGRYEVAKLFLPRVNICRKRNPYGCDHPSLTVHLPLSESRLPFIVVCCGILIRRTSIPCF